MSEKQRCENNFIFIFPKFKDNKSMEAFTVKAVFLDIDGTLYSHTTDSVPASALKALEMLKRAGIRIFACTGRNLWEIPSLNMQDVHPDGWLTMNGAYCFGRDGFVFESPLTEEDAETFVRTCTEQDYPCMFLGKDTMVISRYDEEVKRMQDAIHTAMPPVMNVAEECPSPVYMTVPYIPEDMWQDVKTQLKHVKYTRWNELAVDVIHADTGKARAIKETCAYYGWKKKEILSVGDGPNDIGMMEAAGLSVAMGNADSRVKEAADFIADDIDNDGLYKILIELNILKVGDFV